MWHSDSKQDLFQNICIWVDGGEMALEGSGGGLRPHTTLTIKKNRILERLEALSARS